jgi:hypothetical protein
MLTSRTRLAFVVSPLIVPTFAAVWLPNVIAVEVAAIVGYCGMVVLGAPIFGALRAVGWTKLWSAILVGALSGIVAWFATFALVAILLGEGTDGAEAAILDPALRSGAIWPGAAIGALVSMAFWLIARPDRP